MSAAEYNAALPLPLRGKVAWFKKSVESAQGHPENPLTIIRRWMYYCLADMDVQSALLKGPVYATKSSSSSKKHRRYKH